MATDINLLDDKEFLEFQGLTESAQLVQFKDIKADISERLRRGPEQVGDRMPWTKTYELFRFRPGEVTLWAGINGHGKSEILGQVVCWFPYETKSVIASLEMPVSATGARMCRQTIMSGDPTAEYVSMWADATDNIWVYDEQQTVQTRRMIALVGYAGGVLKADHIVIDSLVKCGMKSHDNLDMQKDFVDALCQMAKAYGIHVHLVHHMRKSGSEHEIPDKFSIKGAGEITDLVDNVIICHRNKSKERMIEEGEHVDEMVPDAKLIICKQRHGEYEGSIALWFNKVNHQFMGSPNYRLRWRME